MGKEGRTTPPLSLLSLSVNAGALWQDAAVVRDGNLISSRTPVDLPDFMRAIIAFLRSPA